MGALAELPSIVEDNNEGPGMSAECVSRLSRLQYFILTCICAKAQGNSPSLAITLVLE